MFYFLDIYGWVYWILHGVKSTIRDSENDNTSQVQDVLIYCEPLKVAMVQSQIDASMLSGYDFRHKMGQWNITRNKEAAPDFQQHGETFA